MTKSMVSTFSPDVYFKQQATGGHYYPVFQGGRGFGSLFQAAKNIALPFMKNIVLPVLKDEAGQLIQDVTSGKGLKNSLKNSAKRAGKRVITKALTGKGRKRKKTVKKRRTVKRKTTNFIKKLPMHVRKALVAKLTK